MDKFSIITLNKNNITDFAKERNALLKKAKTEWVLFVDSDEKPTKELLKEVRETINKVPNLKSYFIKRKIYFLGKYIGEDRVLRLGRRDSGRWIRAVHETWDVKTRFGTLNNYIIHNTAASLHDYINKLNKYSDLHAMENMKEGKRTNLIKIIFYPKLKFIQNMVMGRGFVFSMLQSFHSFLGWVKQWELQKR